jgi:hypothetical protein
MAGDAQMIEHTDSGVTFVFTARRQSAHQRGNLGKLRDTWINTRQGVSLVVDNDEQLEPIKRR